jgi:hypothetical protein
MTFTTADLNNLKAALLSGATLVHIGDREVRYRSQKDILDAIKMIEDSLATQFTSDSSPNLVQASYKRNNRHKR